MLCPDWLGGQSGRRASAAARERLSSAMETKSNSAAAEELSAPLARLGLLRPEEPAQFRPLTGGVVVGHLAGRGRRGLFCVKRALAKLKVAADWRAPCRAQRRRGGLAAPGRRARCPRAAPAMLGRGPRGGAVRDDLSAAGRHPVWKARLRAGAMPIRHSPARSAATLARIHARPPSAADRRATSTPPRSSSAIRLEPYLLATARAPSRTLARRARGGSRRRRLANKRALVHGDVSPKNILVGPAGPVFLDAECAWYGDPAFDLAFCLNHLLLKCVWTPAGAPTASSRASTRLRAAYLAGVDWEARGGARARAPRGCCRACCWRASTASRRSNTSPRTSDRSACVRVRAPCLLRRRRRPLPTLRDGLGGARWR